MKEKIVNFGKGGIEGVEEEISYSFKSILSNGNENKEVLHVLPIVMPERVDLTKDQFPKIVDRIPYPITISFPIKEGSKKATNPLIV